jgi:hypothetical protein
MWSFVRLRSVFECYEDSRQERDVKATAQLNKPAFEIFSRLHQAAVPHPLPRRGCPSLNATQIESLDDSPRDGQGERRRRHHDDPALVFGDGLQLHFTGVPPRLLPLPPRVAASGTTDDDLTSDVNTNVNTPQT